MKHGKDHLRKTVEEMLKKCRESVRENLAMPMVIFKNVMVMVTYETALQKQAFRCINWHFKLKYKIYKNVLPQGIRVFRSGKYRRNMTVNRNGPILNLNQQENKEGS
jgi:hypothetical protein